MKTELVMVSEGEIFAAQSLQLSPMIDNHKIVAQKLSSMRHMDDDNFKNAIAMDLFFII